MADKSGSLDSPPALVKKKIKIKKTPEVPFFSLHVLVEEKKTPVIKLVNQAPKPKTVTAAAVDNKTVRRGRPAGKPVRH